MKTLTRTLLSEMRNFSKPTFAMQPIREKGGVERRKVGPAELSKNFALKTMDKAGACQRYVNLFGSG